MGLLWFPTVAGVSLVGIRVLGVRLGWVRVVLCAWFGLATASFALTALINEERPKFALEVTLGLLTMLAWAGLFAPFSQSRAQTRRRTERNRPGRLVSRSVEGGAKPRSTSSQLGSG